MQSIHKVTLWTFNTRLRCFVCLLCKLLLLRFFSLSSFHVHCADSVNCHLLGSCRLSREYVCLALLHTQVTISLYLIFWSFRTCAYFDGHSITPAMEQTNQDCTLMQRFLFLYDTNVQCFASELWFYCKTVFLSGPNQVNAVWKWHFFRSFHMYDEYFRPFCALPNGWTVSANWIFGSLEMCLWKKRNEFLSVFWFV